MNDLEKQMRAFLEEKGIKIGSVVLTTDVIGRVEESTVATIKFAGDKLRLYSCDGYLVDWVWVSSPLMNELCFNFNTRLKNSTKDKEQKETLETLSFKEVIAQIKKGDTYVASEGMWSIREIKYGDRGVEFVYNNWTQLDNESIKTTIGSSARFVKKVESKPVTFQEALDSYKQVRIEHKYIDAINDDDLDGISHLENTLSMLKQKQYTNMNDIWEMLSYVYSYRVIEIINNGKWYIEE